MDHVWFSKDELEMWVPDIIKTGQKHELPKIIKDRLFRFHLVDNVRGQTLPFASQEIKNSQLFSEITDITDNIVKLKFSGDSYAVAKGPWQLGQNDWTPTHDLDHSIRTSLLGDAVYDMKKKSSS